MQLRIATYNINSIRIRLKELALLVEEARPHIVCLQETKVEDALFPMQEVKQLGFNHIHISGQKSYNGVAILSTLPFTLIPDFNFLESGHKRHIGATLENGIEIHNFYVPAGGDIPDPVLNSKFDFKLKFCDSLIEWSANQKCKRIILVGDLNIAPQPNDVWSHKQLLRVVSHTPVETEKMEKFRQTLGWIDTARHFVPESEKLYSWWSYRNQDWAKSDRGRRLDHIWITPALLPALKSSVILRHARSWPNPSDHVPVLATLTL